jgi:hypothetical protein
VAPGPLVEHIMPIQPHLPHDHAFGTEDVAVLSIAMEDALRSLGLIDRIDPAVLMIAKRIIAAYAASSLQPARGAAAR